MNPLFLKISPSEIFGFVALDNLDDIEVLHLLQEVHHYLVVINDYDRKKMKKWQFEDQVPTGYDRNEMWRTCKSCIDRLEKNKPSLLVKIPMDFLPGGKFYNHPSTWGK